VWVSRARQRVRFPCEIALVAATNPCPCGWFGDPLRPCRCGTGLRERYWGKLAGPLMDRIDLQVVVRRLDAADLGRRYRPDSDQIAPESSAVVAGRVAAARSRMGQRNPRGMANSRLSGQQLRQHGQFEPLALELWQQAMEQRGLSARSCERVLRVARTIADLSGDPRVGPGAVAEALNYRSFDQGREP
jgi:magnesium chelatase family protein